MTVSYIDDVATVQDFGFWKLLARWRGSVYKLIWKDLVIFLFIYYVLQFWYRGMNRDDCKIFEAWVNYCSFCGKHIPLSFILGFFVANVMTRWWNQYQSIPWPTSIAVYVSSTIHGYDEVGRAMRRTIMRYVCLCLTMVLRVLSPRVKKRFPKTSDLVDAGLVHENELAIIDDLERRFPGVSKNFLPIVWAASIVTRARKEGRISDDFAMKTLIGALNKFRGECAILMTYNTIAIPLVYVQVVTFAVYSYFLVSLMGQQHIRSGSDTESIDKPMSIIAFVPLMSVLEFLFYMGWLKVAETLINPFGEDDDDFEVNYLIDRNLQMSYLIVDDMHKEHPELMKDAYWNDMPSNLPDLARDENSEPNKNLEQDFINYNVTDRRSSLTLRRSITIRKETEEPKKSDDVESGQKSTRSSISILPDMIPRPSIVSGKFNNPEILKEQKIIERRMNEIRRESQDWSQDELSKDTSKDKETPKKKWF